MLRNSVCFLQLRKLPIFSAACLCFAMTLVAQPASAACMPGGPCISVQPYTLRGMGGGSMDMSGLVGMAGALLGQAIGDAIANSQSQQTAPSAPKVNEAQQRRYEQARQINNVGVVASERGDFDEAIRNYQKAYSLRPDAFYLANIENAKASQAAALALAAIGNNNLEGAISYRKLQLEHAELALKYAKSSSSSDQRANTARGLLNAKINLYYVQGLLAAKNGKLSEANSLYGQILALFPGDKTTLGNIALNDAWLAYQAHDYSRAISKQQEAISYTTDERGRQERLVALSKMQADAKAIETAVAGCLLMHLSDQSPRALAIITLYGSQSSRIAADQYRKTHFPSLRIVHDKSYLAGTANVLPLARNARLSGADIVLVCSDAPTVWRDAFASLGAH